MLLAQKEAAEILMLNRSVEKAELVAEEVNGIAGKRLVRAMPLEAFDRLPKGEKYLAVQATNVGMFPHTEDVIIREDAFYERIHTGYDLIFNPADTRFMQMVRIHGGRAFGGMKMLLYQGIIAYELWTGETVDKELAEEIYDRLTSRLAAE